MKKVFLFLAIISCCSSCNLFMFGDYKLKISNNSDKIIYYQLTNYPDTTVTFPSPLKSPETYKVNPEESKGVFNRNKWEQDLKPNDKLSVFIFDEKILQTEQWEDIKESKKYLKRIDIGYKEIIDNGWVIIYK